ncbi:heat shock 70 kDa protein 12A [Rhizoctonia solani AG-3 Rhs1AP]|uniref:Heat shock 70 kDa protein 12A n=2 Tax=Rhizoctonia solani AG-3 TaxID=1086053 RepID=A0A074RJ39_9AGAM|nr:heat shock 70 kDa protein 12A [Rhizoctonia solani AG-3 Rhs1AP]KEP45390.1 heat shock 70 kDa protein 12A [Rhizoctonia solani 123E]
MAGPIDTIPKPLRGPWEAETKLVVAIDIGTTQSGVAFTFLESGRDQVIHRISSWPGQAAHNLQAKVPTLVWYDASKKAVSFGAECLLPDVELEAEDERWSLAKHFKLHLHPSDMKAKHAFKLDALPPGVSLRQIYSDFMGYLFKHTKSYFEDRIVDGKQIWSKYKTTMDIIIAHPNGWGLRQQVFLRSAMVATDLIPADQASRRIRFVTEAEASLHYCIYHTNLGSRLIPGTDLIICDAGGSTVDTSAYSIVSARPVLQLGQKSVSACVQSGAIFVDLEAEKYLRSTLTNSGLPLEEVMEYTATGVKDFESYAKRSFHNDTAAYTIGISHSRLNDPSIRTRRGRMTLPGSVVESFFDPCVQEVVSSIDQMLRVLQTPYILLVGGLGDSPYIRKKLKERYDPQKCQVTLTNESASKAVADGAVIWSITSHISSRSWNYSIGVDCCVPFDYKNPEHRDKAKFVAADGKTVVYGAWSPIVPKGVALDANAVFRETYTDFFEVSKPELKVFEMDLFAYSGDGEPDWVLDEKDNALPEFRKLCTIRADLGGLKGALSMRRGSRGVFWGLKCDVCLRLGETELVAYLEWDEMGVKHTSSAYIVPSDPINL